MDAGRSQDSGVEASAIAAGALRVAEAAYRAGLIETGELVDFTAAMAAHLRRMADGQIGPMRIGALADPRRSEAYFLEERRHSVLSVIRRFGDEGQVTDMRRRALLVRDLNLAALGQLSPNADGRWGERTRPDWWVAGTAGHQRAPDDPSVDPLRSLTWSQIFCLEDEKPRGMKLLKKHLKARFGMTGKQYLQKWGLDRLKVLVDWERRKVVRVEHKTADEISGPPDARDLEAYVRGGCRGAKPPPAAWCEAMAAGWCDYMLTAPEYLHRKRLKAAQQGVAVIGQITERGPR